MMYKVNFYYDNGCVKDKSYAIVNASSSQEAKDEVLKALWKYTHVDTVVELIDAIPSEEVIVIGKEWL